MRGSKAFLYSALAITLMFRANAALAGGIGYFQPYDHLCVGGKLYAAFLHDAGKLLPKKLFPIRYEQFGCSSIQGYARLIEKITQIAEEDKVVFMYVYLPNTLFGQKYEKDLDRILNKRRELHVIFDGAPISRVKLSFRASLQAIRKVTSEKAASYDVKQRKLTDIFSAQMSK